MTIPFDCDDKETLVAYVYGELPPDERDAFAQHLAACAACAAEVSGVGTVRQALSGWQPPEPQFEVTVSPRAAVVPMPAAAMPPSAASPAGWTTLPVWARAAAAVLVIGVGLGAANVQIRSDASGLSITTGWMAPAAPPAAASARVQTAATPAAPGTPVLQPADTTQAWRSALADLEARLKADMRSTRAATSADDGAAVLRKVEALITESEQRQRQEFAVRLAQLGRDVDMQRRADLVRLEQGEGQMQGRTGAEVARQRELLNYIVRTSMQRPQQ
jgi:anti-sigma factor RsiW